MRKISNDSKGETGAPVLERRNQMNVRKSVDYITMFAALGHADGGGSAADGAVL